MSINKGKPMPKIPHGPRRNLDFAKKIIQAYLKDDIFLNYKGYLYDVKQYIRDVKKDIQDGYYSIGALTKN